MPNFWPLAFYGAKSQCATERIAATEEGGVTLLLALGTTQALGLFVTFFAKTSLHQFSVLEVSSKEHVSEWWTVEVWLQVAHRRGVTDLMRSCLQPRFPMFSCQVLAKSILLPMLGSQ